MFGTKLVFDTIVGFLYHNQRHRKCLCLMIESICMLCILSFSFKTSESIESSKSSMVRETDLAHQSLKKGKFV